jgi:hypothetical protein
MHEFMLVGDKKLGQEGVNDDDHPIEANRKK